MQPTPIFTARRNDVVVEEVVDELLIYDRRADVGHCLGDIAAVVWRTCDGGATLGEIAEQLVTHDLAGSGVDATKLADAAASELVEKGLLDTPSVRASYVSRRQALRRMAGAGAAAVMAPLVVSAAVPTGAAAAQLSCKGKGVACTGTGQGNCCSGLSCCGGTCKFPNGHSCSVAGDCCSGNCQDQNGTLTC